MDQERLICRYWNIARIHTIKPKVVKSHHNQVLSEPDAKSVECLTIKVHFARERPNPAKAPYLQKNQYVQLLLDLGLSYSKVELQQGGFFSGMEP